MSTYATRGAVIDRLLTELGDPPMVAVTHWGHQTDVQLEKAHISLGGDIVIQDGGYHWRAEIEREDLRIKVCSYMPAGAA